MRAWIHAARAMLVGVLALVGCSQDPNVTAGCQAGNRSQCVVQASMGSHFGCALLTDHSVWCWGRNDESQLGYATMDVCNEDIGGGQTRSVACHTFPFQVHGLDHVTSVVSGDAFSCALRDDGTVRCWGANESGQLGNGRTLPSADPVPVGITHVTALALGAHHACAIANGIVQCWGANENGQLGATTSSMCTVGSTIAPCSLAPVTATGIAGAVELAAGSAHTCARVGGGQVLCWGDNTDGQLGNGMPGPMSPTTRMPVRTASQALGSVVAITAGSFHTCALRDSGAVYCWGRNDHGELGLPVPSMTTMGCNNACSPVAIAVQGLPAAPSPIGGMDGGMGGSDASVDAHVDAAGVRDASMTTAMGPTAIAAGEAFTCAVLADTTVRCWGSDAVAQLGDGHASTDPQGPAMVIAQPGAAANNPLQSVTALASGAAATCAHLTDGSLRCWGSNQDGALGTGSTSPQLGPVPLGW